MIDFVEKRKVSDMNAFSTRECKLIYVALSESHARFINAQIKLCNARIRRIRICMYSYNKMYYYIVCNSESVSKIYTYTYNEPECHAGRSYREWIKFMCGKNPKMSPSAGSASS